MNRKLHIQIILYNSLEFLDLLCKSAVISERDNWDVNFHFVIHDENSLEAYKNKISAPLNKSGIKYTIDKNENVGFGSGHNFLYKKYKDEYEDFFMILNPDLIFFNDFFLKLNETLIKLKNFGLIAFNQFPLSQPEYYDPKTWEINWAAGTATLIDKLKFEEVGMFDENFFMYYEDVDLSWRFRLKKFKVFYSAICKFGHFGAASSKSKGETAGTNKFTSINMLAGQAYISKKYKIKNDEEIEELFKVYPDFGGEAKKQYKKMIKDFNQLKKTNYTNFKSLDNKRWFF